MEKNEKIKEHLNNKTRQYEQSYNVLYDQYKRLSTMIFTTKINTDEILELYKDAYKADEEEKALIRKKLYEKLNNTYTLLKQYNLKQLHFHLPNNDSF